MHLSFKMPKDVPAFYKIPGEFRLDKQSRANNTFRCNLRYCWNYLPVFKDKSTVSCCLRSCSTASQAKYSAAETIWRSNRRTTNRLKKWANSYYFFFGFCCFAPSITLGLDYVRVDRMRNGILIGCYTKRSSKRVYITWWESFLFSQSILLW